MGVPLENPRSKSAYLPYPGGGGPRSRFDGGEGGSYAFGGGKSGLGLWRNEIGQGNENTRILTALVGILVLTDRIPSYTADRRPCGHVFEDKWDLKIQSK